MALTTKTAVTTTVIIAVTVTATIITAEQVVEIHQAVILPRKRNIRKKAKKLLLKESDIK